MLGDILMGKITSRRSVVARPFAAHLFLLLTCTGTASAQDSPVTCGTTIENGATIISCDVREDAVVLSDVSLNRGRCNSPRKLADGVVDRILTYIQERPTTEEQLTSTLFVVSMMGAMLEITNSQQIAGIANGSVDLASVNDPNQPDLPLQIGVYLLATNVFKEYGFGETISIAVSDCNLLEYNLTISGTEYTWQN